MRRVSVVGCSGAGKTTLARALAGRLGVPFVELDAIYHQPGWQELSADEFAARVEAAVQSSAWVVDGNYSKVRPLVWARADTVVWLDLPRWRVMGRLIRRTLRRVITREELWNGNREPWSNLTTFDPYRSIIAWSWTRHAVYRQRYSGAMTDPTNSRLRFERLQSDRDVDRLFADLDSQPAPD